MVPPPSLSGLLYSDVLTKRIDGIEICNISTHNGTMDLVPDFERTASFRERVVSSSPRFTLDSNYMIHVRRNGQLSYRIYPGGRLEPEQDTDYVVGVNLARDYSRIIGIPNLEELLKAGKLDWFEKPPSSRAAKLPSWVRKEDIVPDKALRTVQLFLLKEINALLDQ